MAQGRGINTQQAPRCVEASVRHHGTGPWHWNTAHLSDEKAHLQKRVRGRGGSRRRETNQSTEASCPRMASRDFLMLRRYSLGESPILARNTWLKYFGW